MNEFLFRITDVLPVLMGVLTAIATLGGAILSLRRYRMEASEGKGGINEVAIARIRSELAHSHSGAPIPFEIEQLANYYSLTLGQARVSFWFSLIFAAIGFVVIVGAAVLYKDGGYMSATIKISSGLVIDAVSALFFVQSRRAQDSMSAFFEKLRNDRQFVEARKICEEISDKSIKDQLKTILVLHYSGLEAAPMFSTLNLGDLVRKNLGHQQAQSGFNPPVTGSTDRG